MKKCNKNPIATLLAIALTLSLSAPIATFAATSPTLTGASSYSVLAGSTVTNTGSTTTSGDVGVSPGTAITGFPPGIAAGDNGTHLHSNDASAIAAQADNLTTFGTLDQGCDHSYADGQDLTLLSPLGPGVYCSAGSFSLSGNLTLTGSGVWIFKSVSTLITSPGSSVTGGDPCNVWWRVGSSATLDTTTSFIGNIFALASITMNNGATLNGRALAQTAAVTLNNNTISGPTCTAAPATLHIIKTVVNTGGGTAVPSDFSVHVKNAGVEVTGSPAAGTATPGTTYSLAAGTYVVSEDDNPSYTRSFTGDCDSSGSITLTAGIDRTCTITNTYIPPAPPANATLHVIKLVVGGTTLPSSFSVHVKNAGVEVTGSPAAGTATPGTTYSLAAGTYVVSEDDNPSYTRSFTGDCDSSGSITLTAGIDRTCTIVNTNIPVPTPVTPSSGGTAYIPRIVPLIGIVKVPTPLALPAGSGKVTYNYTVWDVGAVQELTDVTVRDDKCGPVVLLSGDINNNSKLDLVEKWKYSCTTTLSKTTTNTAVATGYSNDIYHQPAIATAIATVVVGAPVPPPLINIVKIPSRLTPFPFGGGNVKYTYVVTNPGVVAMHDVVVTDDKCGPVSGPSGDTNGNKLFEPSETWTYTCLTNVPFSTRNIATVKGSANGFIALGYAFANVLVNAPGPQIAGTSLHSAAPGFPNTGLPPKEKSTSWDNVILAGILMLASASLVVVLRKRKI